ncbi:DNA repair protein RecO [Patescibacteria group bacterium]|nr:DNA repair protein RecO [Patescibacteria group bacterium]
MSTYKTQAIILRENDYINADRLFYVYTQNYGKVILMVKGGKKIQSKLTPHLQNFSIVNLLIAKGKTFDRLASSQILHYYQDIKNNFEKIAIAYNFLELVDKSTHVYHPDEKIFNLLVENLEALNDNRLDIIQLKNLSNFFTIRFLNILGYSLQLYNCLYCKKKIESNENYFYPRKGSIACSKCLPTKSDRIIKISDDAIKVLRMVILENPQKLIKIKIDSKLSIELEKLITEFTKFHLDSQIKSKEFIAQTINP